MSHRCWVQSTALGVVLAVGLLAPAFAAAQAPPSAAAKAAATSTGSKTPPTAAAKTSAIPRAADGHPDLHGYYNFLTVTPLQRPAKYGNREFLTPQETKDVFEKGLQSAFEPRDGDEEHYGNELFNPNSVDYDPTTFGLSPWQNGIKPNPRTSLVVDPPDGRIPDMTAEAKAAKARPVAPAAAETVDLAGSQGGNSRRGSKLCRGRPQRRRRGARGRSAGFGIRHHLRQSGWRAAHLPR